MSAMWRAALVLLVGCGGSLLTEPDAAPPADAPPFVPGPNLVRLDTFGPPDYIRYRDGRGSWTEPERDADGRYELHVTHDYEIVTACGESFFGFEAYLDRFTVDDGPHQIVWGCFWTAFQPAPTQVSIRGTMLQRGSVSFDDVAHSETAPWTFQLEVTPGIHDLIAFSSTRIALRRGQEVTGSGSIATIDLAAEGTALEIHRFTVATVPNEIVRSELWLETAHGRAAIPGGIADVLSPPASLREPGDRLELSIRAQTARTRRALHGPFVPPLGTIDLLPPLDVSFSFPNLTLWASWTELPRHLQAGLVVFAFNGSQEVWATRSWLEARGAAHLAFEGLPEDYDPAWHCELGGPYHRRFTIYDGDAGTRRSSEIAEGMNGW
jgi:hypothetical protein